MTDSKNKKMISGEMLVGQIVNEYPQAVEILMEVGMHSRCRRPLCKADYKAGWKLENSVVYTFAERMLSQELKDKIDADFKAFEDEQTKLEVQEKYLRMMDDFIA